MFTSKKIRLKADGTQIKIPLQVFCEPELWQLIEINAGPGDSRSDYARKLIKRGLLARKPNLRDIKTVNWSEAK